MKFRTKKELLEYLGKNPNDRRLIDRMIIKGEVHMENRMYIYESKEIVLEEKVKELEKEIKNLKENGGNSDELYEARVQWEYWENECRRYGRLTNLVIETVYKKIKPMLGSRLEDFDTFKEGIIEEVKKIEGLEKSD